MAVYLLHFDPPYRHAKHYTGFTDLEPGERLARAVASYALALVAMLFLFVVVIAL